MNVLDRTRALWTKQHDLVGGRFQLFSTVADAVDANTVLYPGSYVDLTPAFVWPSVTFVDVDRRANQFFSDRNGVRQLLSEHEADPAATPSNSCTPTTKGRSILPRTPSTC